MKKIIYVCSGNICRSPTAHHYMQKKIKDMGIENKYMITSCGTYAIQDQKATDFAIEVMLEYGVDMHDHRATQIGNSNIQECDYIFCLTDMHRVRVLRLYPELNGKVYVLKQFVNPDVGYIDIDDPYGYSLEVYQACAKEIVENVDKIIEKLEWDVK